MEKLKLGGKMKYKITPEEAFYYIIKNPILALKANLIYQDYAEANPDKVKIRNHRNFHFQQICWGLYYKEFKNKKRKVK
jgi:hypothetical protein